MRYTSALHALMDQFQICRSVAVRTIQLARILMAADEEERRPHVRAAVVARLERLVDKAEEAKDWSAAVRALREMVRIYGLAAPIEVTNTIKHRVDLDDMTDEQIAALAALDQAREASGDGGDEGDHGPH